MIKLKDILTESKVHGINEGIFDGLKKVIDTFKQNIEERKLISISKDLVNEFRTNISKIDPSKRETLSNAIKKSRLLSLIWNMRSPSSKLKETPEFQAATKLCYNNKKVYEQLQSIYHQYLEDDWKNIDQPGFKSDMLKITSNINYNWKS
jgi:chromosome condensin MukBEF MukE localization factor